MQLARSGFVSILAATGAGCFGSTPHRDPKLVPAAKSPPVAAHAHHHHLSVVLADTHIVDTDESGLTVGSDYEYRTTEHLGVGMVAEHAFGPVGSTTALAVTDIHLWHGLTIQAGPGVELRHHAAHPVGRLGVVYELELGAVTLAPQIHDDVSATENALVVGFGVGHTF